MTDTPSDSGGSGDAESTAGDTTGGLECPRGCVCPQVCHGECELFGGGACPGECHGDCSGECQKTDVDGECAGTCDGMCEGVCVLPEGGAACDGTCYGSCAPA